MAKLYDSKTLKKKVDGVTKRSHKLSDDIHVVAAHVCVHAIVHGDVTLATRLVTGLSKGISRRALTAWMAERAPMKWENAEKAFKYQPKRRDQFDANRAEEILEDYLNGPKFYDREPNDNQLEVDVLKLLRSIPAKVDNARENGREVRNAHLVEKVQAILAEVA